MLAAGGFGMQMHAAEMPNLEAYITDFESLAQLESETVCAGNQALLNI